MNLKSHLFLTCFRSCMFPLFLVSTHGHAASNLSAVMADGVITATGSPYYAATNVVLSNMTIQAGVRFLITGPYQIIVKGSLVATGTANFPIVFKSATNGRRWSGLIITNSAINTALEFVQIHDAANSGLQIFSTPLTLRFCDISGNIGTQGGGIDTDSSLKLDQCTITNNSISSAAGTGGGIRSRANLLTLRGGIVANNQIVAEASPSSAFGGGIYCSGIIQLLDGCQIVENSIYAHDFPSASSCTSFGGGIWSDSGIFATNVLIARNQARCFGDNHAPTPLGGGVFCNRDVVFAGCEVSDNSADNVNSGASFGGGVFCRSLTAISTVFNGNSTTANYNYGSDAGAIRVSAIITLVNCLLSHNSNVGGTSVQQGSAIMNGDPGSLILNCTIADNVNIGSSAGALFNFRGAITNSILYGNNIRSISGSSPSAVAYTLIEDGTSGTGNTNADPRFLDNSDYFLSANSPAIDAGDPNPAFYDAGPHALGTLRNDMGVYGGPGALPVVGYLQPLLITSYPASQLVSIGSTVQFNVAASGGNGPLHFQWRFNGVDVVSATQSSLILTNVGFQQAGHYSVTVSTLDQSLTSGDATLSVTQLKLYAGITISGIVGATYRIEYSPPANPGLFTTLTNIVLPSSPYFYLDYESGDAPSRFYRFSLLTP